MWDAHEPERRHDEADGVRLSTLPRDRNRVEKRCSRTAPGRTGAIILYCRQPRIDVATTQDCVDTHLDSTVVEALVIKVGWKTDVGASLHPDAGHDTVPVTGRGMTEWFCVQYSPWFSKRLRFVCGPTSRRWPGGNGYRREAGAEFRQTPFIGSLQNRVDNRG